MLIVFAAATTSLLKHFPQWPGRPHEAKSWLIVFRTCYRTVRSVPGATFVEGLTRETGMTGVSLLKLQWVLYPGPSFKPYGVVWTDWVSQIR